MEQKQILIKNTFNKCKLLLTTLSSTQIFQLQSIVGNEYILAASSPVDDGHDMLQIGNGLHQGNVCLARQRKLRSASSKVNHRGFQYL